MVENYSGWDNGKLSRVKIKWAVILGLGDFMDAYTFVAAGLMILLFKINFPSITLLEESFVPFSLSFGVFFGAFFGGRLGDKYGRRKIFMWDMGIYAAAALIGGFSTSILMFLVLFWVMGFALGIDVPTSWTLLAEISPINKRQTTIAIPWAFWFLAIPCTYSVDLLILYFHLGSYSFRTFIWIIAVLGLVVFISRRSIVESPRWLAEHGDIKEFESETKKYTKVNPIPEKNANKNTKLTFSTFFKYYKKYFIWVSILYIAWGLGSSSFGTFSIFILPGLGITTLLEITIFEWIGTLAQIIAGLIWSNKYADKVSRTKAFRWTVAFAIVFMVIVIIASFLVNPILGIIGLIPYMIVTAMAYPSIRTWSVETWPTEFRSTMQGQVWSYMRLATAIWLFAFLPIKLLVKIPGVMIIVLALMVITFIAGSFFMIPDANKKSLEQIRSERLCT